jgi:lactate dehydrogenase-like 2-hydroxyacid dehydrogenase
MKIKVSGMRVVAYSIKSFEKEPLAIANHKKHDITLISNSLSPETLSYAEGKEAVIVFNQDYISEAVINKLADLGVKYIATRSTAVLNIDQDAAAKRNIKIANVPAGSLLAVSDQEMSLALARETILNLDKWQQNRCLGSSCVCSRSCDQADLKIPGHEH